MARSENKILGIIERRNRPEWDRQHFPGESAWDTGAYLEDGGIFLDRWGEEYPFLGAEMVMRDFALESLDGWHILYANYSSQDFSALVLLEKGGQYATVCVQYTALAGHWNPTPTHLDSLLLHPPRMDAAVYLPILLPVLMGEEPLIAIPCEKTALALCE